MSKFPKGSIRRARSLRRKSTPAERELWRHLRNRRLGGFKFRRQHPCGPYTLDFFCAETALAVEVDGGGHGYPGHEQGDEVRDKYLAGQGIETVRIWNHQVHEEPETVLEKIRRALETSSPHPDPLPGERE